MIKLPPMPERIAALPRDARGYPVPWFVEWVDGVPQFPIMSVQKWLTAVSRKRCWVCGEQLGSFLAFVVGPMCGINRTTAEPPSHLECATFSVRACPFLVNPNMKRIENDLTRAGESPAGVMIKRNPGVSLVWVTKDYRIFDDGSGGKLIRIGDAKSISFWKEGRLAMTEEVLASIESGCPAIEALIRTDDERASFFKAKRKFLEESGLSPRKEMEMA